MKLHEEIGLNALSRLDNETYVCTTCGDEQSTLGLIRPDAWPLPEGTTVTGIGMVIVDLVDSVLTAAKEDRLNYDFIYNLFNGVGFYRTELLKRYGDVVNEDERDIADMTLFFIDTVMQPFLERRAGVECGGESPHGDASCSPVK
jgi:hypothetical protein